MDKFHELVSLYQITIGNAEWYKSQGEAHIQTGIELLKKGEAEYKDAYKIREQIQELGETEVIK